MKGSQAICRAIDVNVDGTFDVYLFYNDQGRVRRRQADLDTDGLIDKVDLYEAGKLKESRLDTNADGRVDTWKFFQGDKLIRQERATKGNGQINQWWEYRIDGDPNCPVVYHDADDDGQADERVEPCAGKRK